jgi:hypothetical protein
MSGFDQRDFTRKTTSSNKSETSLPLDGRPLAEALQDASASGRGRAIYHIGQAEDLTRDRSFCDAIAQALTLNGGHSESVALMNIVERGSAGLLAIKALINDPSPIDRRLQESGFYDRGSIICPPNARPELVATKLTHLVFHLESTSRALSPEDSKVAADILLELSKNSTFDRAKRHALRVLPTVMRGQGRDYEDPVAHERTRGGGLMD